MWIVTIDHDLCEGDGDCVSACPAAILALKEESAPKAVVQGSLEECLGCEACTSTCHTGAITLTEV